MSNICEVKYYRIIILKFPPAAKYLESLHQEAQMKLKISKRHSNVPKTKAARMREKQTDLPWVP